MEFTILLIDLLGTFAFAVTGASKAITHKLNVVGVTFLAIMTGIGGGITRDVLLGVTPLALEKPQYIITCIVGAVSTLVFKAMRYKKYRLTIMVLDTLGLGFFTAVGAQKAYLADANCLTIVLMGTTTAVFGGIIRDVLANEVPSALKTGFYAGASIIGGFVYIALNSLILPHTPLLLITTAVVFVLHLKWIKIV